LTKTGYIEKVIYKNEDNGYAVFAVEGEDGEDVFVGNLHGVAEGLYVSAEGEYVSHPTYDLQFKFTSCTVKTPSDLLGIERYLGSGIIKGIGEAMAKRIVKKFKMDSLRIIEEEPERLAEIKGISAKKARDIAISYNEKKSMQDAIMFLTGYGISVNLAVKIYNEYGEGLYNVINTNPYKIAEDINGVGFRTADELAEKIGISTDSEFRVRAAIMYTLLNANRLGHMYLPQEELTNNVCGLLVGQYQRADEELRNSVDNQIVELNTSKKIVIREIEGVNAVYSAANYYIELNSAKMLKGLNIDFSRARIDIDSAVRMVEDRDGIELAQSQIEAIRKTVGRGVAVITGGPGTGKTTIINVLLKIYESYKMSISLAAPTGRAAKRITEATGYGAQTIHRLLELTGGAPDDDSNGATYTFLRNEDNPLEADVIILDEVSMVDSGIFYSLLKAITPGTRLILVGDSNQLPSVGPGNVLRDIIASGEIAVSVLDTIYRQGQDSGIITNAHKINAGEHIPINNKSKDFFFIPRNGYNDIISELKLLLTKQLPNYYKVDSVDIQVLTPMRKMDLGVENLNRQLQQLLNPEAKNKKEHDRGDLVFRCGDKVMQIKNNYKREWKLMDLSGQNALEEGVGVFNGDIGFVKDVDNYDQKLVVEFDDGRQSDYAFNQLDELEHAFAITIHKSQGSEYPIVVLPLLSCPPKLLNKNLLYTAVTRAKICVVIVGNINLINTMIDNMDEQKRYTSFAQRLQEL
jgi:exodeoxyribonuclease V alpha subunit